jgi:hypothetical protein
VHRGTWRNTAHSSPRAFALREDDTRLSAQLRLAVALPGLVLPIRAAQPAMTIRILDQAKIPGNMQDQLERYVATTLASIQVGVNWVDCSTNLAACERDRGPNEFWLRILAQTPPRVNGGIDLLGFTQRADDVDHPIPCVNIFYPMVKQVAERERVDAGLILGPAVVHEIGHLYLGTNSQAHSATGVMCGVWAHRQFELASIGELNFTSEQAARIRGAMRSTAPSSTVFGSAPLSGETH